MKRQKGRINKDQKGKGGDSVIEIFWLNSIIYDPKIYIDLLRWLFDYQFYIHPQMILFCPAAAPLFKPFCGEGRGCKYVSQGGRPPTPRGSGVHPCYKLMLEDAIQANFPFTMTNLLTSVQYVTFFCVEENDLEILFQRIKYGDLAVQIFLDTELS